MIRIQSLNYNALSREEMTKGHILERIWPFSGSAGIRTQDPYIKSVLLYQLSYRTKINK
jgi:hypothetical protein